MVVVGAGLAGLAAATALSERDVDVTVLEARDRVGGRVWSDQVATPEGLVATIERGAEFVLAGYERFRAYADRHDLALTDTAMSYYVREVADRPEVTPVVLAAAAREAVSIWADGPAGCSAAALLDRLAVDDDVRDALRARIEISSAAAADAVDASVLEHVASLEPQPSWRLSGGNQRLAESMAGALQRPVRLREVVTAVRDGGAAVHITTETGELTVDAAVVALPLAVLRSGRVHLPLPDPQAAAIARLGQGHAAKLHLPLTRPSAPSAVMSAEHRFWTWTAAAEGGMAPVLNCFTGSAEAVERLGVAAGAERWHGLVRGMRPDLPYAAGEPVLTHWAVDPYALGAYSAPPPGWTSADDEALHVPAGRVLLAGEYTAGDMGGLMEGALRSGERAAERLLTSAPPAGGARRR